MKYTILVCGFGSIAKRHIVNLTTLVDQVLCWNYRDFTASEQIFLETHRVISFTNLDVAIRSSDAVVIATPTDTHVDIALTALACNKHIYFEKPLSHEVSSVDSFLSIPKGIVLEIGCQLRNHPSLIKLKSLTYDKSDISGYRFSMGHRLDLWRPLSDYRNSFSSDIDRGGGALFELVHMIDMAIWLFGPIHKVSALLSKRGPLDIKKEDFCILSFIHSNGIVGQIQLDMVSAAYRCYIEVIGFNNIYDFNLSSGTLKCSSSESTTLMNSVSSDYTRNDLFIKHMSHFLNRLSDPSLPPICSIEDGIHALKVLVSSRRSHEFEQWVSIRQ